MASAAETVEQARDRLRFDTAFWAKHCATVLTPRREPVRLIARPWQARTPETPPGVTPLDEALETQRAKGLPMRVIVLKARKLGMSTWIQARQIQRVTQRPFEYALTVAHRDDASAQLLRMAALMYDRLPTEEELGLGFSIKPQLVAKSTPPGKGGYLSFGDKMRPMEVSLYETQTAGSEGGGRASTPSAIHASEVAFWRSAAYLTGLMNALPLEPGTECVLESTANGFNFFQELWQRAVEGAEDPDTGVLWTPLFYGWHMNPYNAFPFASPEARDRFERTVGDEQGGGDPEEVELVEEFGVTLEQLNWRRQIINGPECQGNLDVFHQEHPSTPQQAFIGSGRPVFPGILVSRMIRAAEESHEPFPGVLRGTEWKERPTRSGTIRVPQKALWVPQGEVADADEDLWGNQRLLIWDHPVNAGSQVGRQPHEVKPDGQYVVFCDTAQGEGTAEEGDWTAVQVLDHVSREQVARWRSRIPIHDLPLVLVLIGTYFNTAYLAVEANNMGQSVVDSLAKDFHYRYLYRRRRAGDDERADVKGHTMGWLTTLQSKPLMEITFGQVLKDGTHGLRDVVTGREFTTYVKDPKNAAKHGAQPGAFDDLAVSFMGVHRVASELRPRDPSAGGTKRLRGWGTGDRITGG